MRSEMETFPGQISLPVLEEGRVKANTKFSVRGHQRWADEMPKSNGFPPRNILDRPLLEEPTNHDLVKIEAELDSDMPGNDISGIYLRDISRVQLLTPEQEIELGRQCSEGRVAKDQLYDPAISTILDIERKQALERQVAEGHNARNKLVEANLRLVVSVARKYQGRGLLLQDLIQEGNIGVSRAAEKYDYTKGFRFSTYAYWWIRQAVTRAIADQSRTIRIPVHVIDSIGHILRVEKDLQQQLDHEPTYDEIGKAMGLTAKRVQEIMGAAQFTISIETPVGEDEDGATIADFIRDKNIPAPDIYADNEGMRQSINEVLANLLPREQRVVSLRFGLEDGCKKTLSEIGEALGVSRERVRQIEAEALIKLRKPDIEAKLKEFIG
ncbi:MAG: sigma-70 family RNA polymerase sigma factor [Patescibacteria group bacterium]